MKVHLLVNFNVWKPGLEIPVPRRVLSWIPQKTVILGPLALIGSSDVYLFMFLTEWKFKLD